MSEFSDRPFAAGSLVGVRAFDVDGLGRLVGPSYRTVFTPGENVATCGGGTAIGKINAAMTAALSRAFTYQIGEGSIVATPKDPPAEPREHVVSGLGCSCGYYAYFDGKSDYSQSDRVTALVEGYGVCTVASVGVVSAGVTVSPWWLLFLIATLGLIMFAAVTLRADFHAIDREFPRISDLSRCHDRSGRLRLDLVRRNYADTPVYPSLAAAVRAHPLTAPEPPREPGPDDEDFWTRRAS